MPAGAYRHEVTSWTVPHDELPGTLPESVMHLEPTYKALEPTYKADKCHICFTTHTQNRLAMVGQEQCSLLRRGEWLAEAHPAACSGLSNVPKEHSVGHSVVQAQQKVPRIDGGQRQHSNHPCCWYPPQPVQALVSLDFD